MHQVMLNREQSISHLAYERENAFFKSIQDGDVAEMRRLYQPFEIDSMGTLSEDPLRNLQYHLIITIALITRACIEGGMEMEAVRMLHREVVEDYAQRMHLLKKQNRYPRAVTICIDYIYDNLHTKLTLPDLAKAAGLSAGYLSKLFRREVGMNVSEYILKKRIEAAENMLRFSELSCLAIADYLCFSSESHFIQVFRKQTGLTPKRYREAFFRVRNNRRQA